MLSQHSATLCPCFHQLKYTHRAICGYSVIYSMIFWYLSWNNSFCLTLYLPKRGHSVHTRETREGWPLLTVETEVNGDSKITNEKGPSLVGSLGLLCGGTKDICSFALAALVGPVQNIFFLTVPYFNSFVLIALKLGRQPCWVAYLFWYIRVPTPRKNQLDVIMI
jgi:hypothetical protein